MITWEFERMINGERIKNNLSAETSTFHIRKINSPYN